MIILNGVQLLAILSAIVILCIKPVLLWVLLVFIERFDALPVVSIAVRDPGTCVFCCIDLCFFRCVSLCFQAAFIPRNVGGTLLCLSLTGRDAGSGRLVAEGSARALLSGRHESDCWIWVLYVLAERARLKVRHARVLWKNEVSEKDIFRCIDVGHGYTDLHLTVIFCMHALYLVYFLYERSGCVYALDDELNYNANFWYIDSCSTDHVNPNQSEFEKLTKMFRVFDTANGTTTADLKGRGNIRLFDPKVRNCFTFVVENVVLMENCKRNLLSLSKLKEAGVKVDFDSLIVLFPDGNSCRIIAANGLFRLESCAGVFEFADVGPFTAQPDCNTCLLNLSGTFTRNDLRDPELCFYRNRLGTPLEADLYTYFPSSLFSFSGLIKLQPHVSAAVSGSSDEAALWHARLGHFSANYVKFINKKGVNRFPLIPHDYDCDPCDKAKCTRPHFPRTMHGPRKVLGELVHSDIWVCSVEGYGGIFYAVHYTDDASRFTVIYFMKSKIETLSCFKKYLAFCSSLNIVVKELRTDNDSMFVSEDPNSGGGNFMGFCSKNHVFQTFTGPYCHESAGKPERIWRTLITMVSAMLITAHLSTRWWPLAMEHANYVRQRLPHLALDHDVPYTRWFKKDVDYANLHIFGCLCYYHVDASLRHSLDVPGKEALYVGNSHETTAFTLIDIESGKCIQSGMVKKFIEKLDSRGRLIKSDVERTTTDVDVSDLEMSDVVVCFEPCQENFYF